VGRTQLTVGGRVLLRYTSAACTAQVGAHLSPTGCGPGASVRCRTRAPAAESGLALKVRGCPNNPDRSAGVKIPQPVEARGGPLSSNGSRSWGQVDFSARQTVVAAQALRLSAREDLRLYSYRGAPRYQQILVRLPPSPPASLSTARTLRSARECWPARPRGLVASNRFSAIPC